MGSGTVFVVVVLGSVVFRVVFILLLLLIRDGQRGDVSAGDGRYVCGGPVPRGQVGVDGERARR